MPVVRGESPFSSIEWQFYLKNTLEIVWDKISNLISTCSQSRNIDDIICTGYVLSSFWKDNGKIQVRFLMNKEDMNLKKRVRGWRECFLRWCSPEYHRDKTWFLSPSDSYMYMRFRHHLLDRDPASVSPLLFFRCSAVFCPNKEHPTISKLKLL